MSDEVSEEQWKARDDARALSQAFVIMNDSDRLKKAKAAAKKLLEEKAEQAEQAEEEKDALSKLAGISKGKMGGYSKKFKEIYGG